MKELAIIKEINNNKYMCELENSNNCSSCMLSFCEFKSNNTRQLEIFSKETYALGDSVTVIIPDSILRKGILFIYFIPTVLFIGGLIIFYIFLPLKTNGELVSFIVSLLVLIIYFYVLKFFEYFLRGAIEIEKK